MVLLSRSVSLSDSSEAEGEEDLGEEDLGARAVPMLMLQERNHVTQAQSAAKRSMVGKKEQCPAYRRSSVSWGTRTL